MQATGARSRAYRPHADVEDRNPLTWAALRSAGYKGFCMDTGSFQREMQKTKITVK